MKKLCILGYPKCAGWRFWSDCANAQSDLNLHWTHMFEGTFSDGTSHILFFRGLQPSPDGYPLTAGISEIFFQLLVWAGLEPASFSIASKGASHSITAPLMKDIYWWINDYHLHFSFSPLWFEPRSGHMWESQVLLTDGQAVFPRVLRFFPTFGERSARYKWNFLESQIKKYTL